MATWRKEEVDAARRMDLHMDLTSNRTKMIAQLAVSTKTIRITAMKMPVDFHTARCSMHRVNKKRAAGAVML